MTSKSAYYLGYRHGLQAYQDGLPAILADAMTAQIEERHRAMYRDGWEQGYTAHARNVR